MSVKTIDVAKGDLVELTLTPDAFKNKYDFVYPDEEINEPGRKDVGYVSLVKEESIFLCSQWDTVKNRGARGIAEYHFSAIESWKKR